MAVSRPWETSAEWRQAAYAVTSVATECAMCGLGATAFHAMPKNTDAPFDDLVAVCGYCRPHAMTRRVLPEKVVDGPAIWTRTDAQVNDPMRQRKQANPLRPVNERKQAFLDLRDRILARDKEVCQYCFQHGNRVDKINAFKSFSDEENWVCACPRCSAASAGITAYTIRAKRAMIMEARGVEPVTSVITKGHAPLKQRLKQRRRG